MTHRIMDANDPAVRLGTAHATIERRYFSAMATANTTTDTPLKVRQLALAAAYAQAIADLSPVGADKDMWSGRHDRLARESYDLMPQRAGG